MEILIDLLPSTNVEKNVSLSLLTVNVQDTYTTQNNDISLLNQAVDSGNVTSCDQPKNPLLADKFKMAATKNTKVMSIISTKRSPPSTITTFQSPSAKSYHSYSLLSAMKFPTHSPVELNL